MLEFFEDAGKIYKKTKVPDGRSDCRACELPDKTKCVFKCAVGYCYKLIKQETKTMKLSEINFKTICGNEERALAIQKALFERGGTWKDKTTSLLSNPYWCLVWDGACLTWGDLGDFIAKPQNEVTFAQALVEIKKCEPLQKKAGEWVEYAINSGSFIIPTRTGYFSWWNWPAALVEGRVADWLFGGWLFVDSDGAELWDSRYMSRSKEGRLFSGQGCDRVPAIPIKIRFWRPAK